MNWKLLVAPFVLSLGLIFAQNIHAQPGQFGQSTGRPITEFLNPDGTFSNPDNYTGTVDMAGYQLGGGLEGMPSFFSVDDDKWNLQSQYPGTNNVVYALLLVGDDLYIGGSFTNAGGINANRIVRYNITDGTWHALGIGLNNEVYSLAVSGDNLFVGGSFNVASGVGTSRIARYNITDGTWHALGTGVNSSVLSIAVDGDNLYAGGHFITAGGSPANNIARYDLVNETWHPLGSGMDNFVNSIIVNEDNLYLGGNFTSAGGTPANRIVRYNTTDETWHNLGFGVAGIVQTIAISGDNLYVGGWFNSAGGASASRIARYDLVNNTWHAMNGTVVGNVNDLVVIGDQLYIAGNLSSVGDESVRNIARYDLTNDSWESLGSGASGTIYNLLANGDDLYFGGIFTDISEIGAEGVARYDMNLDTWHALDIGINGNVNTILVSGDDLYLGGQFTIAGGIIANRIVRYNITNGTWYALGSGLNNNVFSIIQEGTDLFVGGEFTSAGGITANRVARYDLMTDTWHPLGSGVNGTVNSVALSGDYLIAGGSFSSAGAVSTENIAKYNLMDGTWSDIGGMNSIVNSLLAVGNDVYAAGGFTTAGGSSTFRVARYDVINETWHALGSGVNQVAMDLLQSGDDLYVAGAFWTAGGIGADRVARYNMVNGTWHSLGTDMGGFVRSVVKIGDDLYLGGQFSSAGGLLTNNIVQYNMTTGVWDTMGSGVNNIVRSMKAVDGNLYVGGFFTSAGAKPASYFARWELPVVPPYQVTLVSPTDEATGVPVLTEFTWNAADRAESYELQVSTDQTFATTVIDETGLTDTDFTVSTAFDNATEYFWRVRAVNAGGEGDWSETFSFTTIVAISDQVTLISPADEATGVSVLTEFTWSAADRADSYELQVSTDNTFATSVIDETGLTDTDFTVSTAFDNATEYFWRLRAVNAGGEGDWSETFSFTTIVAITDQVTLVSPADEATGVPVLTEFTWTSADRAESYELQVSTDLTFATTVIDETGLNDTDFTVSTAFDNATKYFWRVRAVNAGGEGDWSETFSFTTIVSVPDVITLSGPSHESTGLSIHPSFSWEPDPLATTYTLQITTDPIFGTGVTTYTDIEELYFNLPVDLEYSTTYYWRVAGVNAAGTGAYNDAYQFTTLDLPVPIQPTVFYPTQGAENVALQPTFSWEDLGDGNIYDFELALNNQYSDPIVALNGITETSFTPEVPLDPQTTYYWRIRAINEYGPGEWNDFFGFTTLIPSNPGQVRDLTIEEIVTVSKVSAIQTTQNLASFLLTWSPPESDGGSPITNYRVVYREADESSWTTYTRDPSTDTTAIVIGFIPGVAYAFDVLAENTVGASEPNEDAPIVVSIETEELPTQVTLNQNYPNPFNPSTTIRFALPTSGEVRLEVYSVLGQRMAVLVSGQQPAGWHTVNLDASNWSSGTYIYRLQADGITMTRKFLLLK